MQIKLSELIRRVHDESADAGDRANMEVGHLYGEAASSGLHTDRDACWDHACDQVPTPAAMLEWNDLRDALAGQFTVLSDRVFEGRLRSYARDLRHGVQANEFSFEIARIDGTGFAHDHLRSHPRLAELLGVDTAALEVADSFPDGLWQQGRWYDRATRGLLSPDMLRMAGKRKSIKRRKRNSRWQYDLTSVCEAYPQHAPRLVAANRTTERN